MHAQAMLMVIAAAVTAIVMVMAVIMGFGAISYVIGAILASVF